MNVQPEGRGARVRLTDAWSRSGGWRYLTAPAAWGYRAALAARRLGFGIGLLHRERVGVPVVSIGNITVGGTGKTPAALWLADGLRRSGWHPAIVTRGYGGTLGRQVITVGTGGFVLATPDKAGDEAVLLADRFPGPVVAGADRVVAARTAVADHDADLIILDDGFQHWRLERDLDIVLIDGRTGFGNGALLPAGPLREPVRALRRAGAIVVTKALRAAPIADMVAHFAVDVPVFIAELVPRALLQVEDGSVVAHPLTTLAGRRVVTVSGIAQPRSFYELLGQLDARSVEVLEFADHHVYTRNDWQRITQAAHRADLIVCTEKDMVKLRRFPFARGLLAALRVDFSLRPRDETLLLDLVARRIAGAREQAAEEGEVLREGLGGAT